MTLQLSVLSKCLTIFPAFSLAVINSMCVSNLFFIELLQRSISRLFMPSRIICSKFASISYPQEFLPQTIAACIVVPVPKNGSRIMSPFCENIFISLYGISNGKAALLSLVFDFCKFCFVPLISHTSENHTFLSSQKKELFMRANFSLALLNIRLSPFLKMRIHSCSKVT